MSDGGGYNRINENVAEIDFGATANVIFKVDRELAEASLKKNIAQVSTDLETRLKDTSSTRNKSTPNVLEGLAKNRAILEQQVTNDINGFIDNLKRASEQLPDQSNGKFVNAAIDNSMKELTKELYRTVGSITDLSGKSVDEIIRHIKTLKPQDFKAANLNKLIGSNVNGVLKILNNQITEQAKVYDKALDEYTKIINNPKLQSVDPAKQKEINDTLAKLEESFNKVKPDYDKITQQIEALTTEQVTIDNQLRSIRNKYGYEVEVLADDTQKITTKLHKLGVGVGKNKKLKTQSEVQRTVDASIAKIQESLAIFNDPQFKGIFSQASIKEFTENGDVSKLKQIGKLTEKRNKKAEEIRARLSDVGGIVDLVKELNKHLELYELAKTAQLPEAKQQQYNAITTEISKLKAESKELNAQIIAINAQSRKLVQELSKVSPNGTCYFLIISYISNTI